MTRGSGLLVHPSPPADTLHPTRIWVPGGDNAAAQVHLLQQVSRPAEGIGDREAGLSLSPGARPLHSSLLRVLPGFVLAVGTQQGAPQSPAATPS